jgi:putative ABC transport system ATP-binding protein
MTSKEPVPIIRLDNATRFFGGDLRIAALNNVSLEIIQGERVAVMGPSGSGKSTLLNLICGLDDPTSGSVLFEGRELGKLDDNDRTRLRRIKIGMVFQTFNLLPTLTSLENVALPLRLNGTTSRQAAEKAREMLDRVGLSGRSNHRPDEMSGGERQRAAIARALIFEPPVLLADEPTGNLDSRSGDELLHLLDGLYADLDMTIVLVTHNEVAASHCERRITLLDGAIVGNETAASPARARGRSL